eukprot:scaffold497_cov97-Cylindrotheca_fusiformis.AAC.6
MKWAQFLPTDCHTCGGNVTYLFEDDDAVHIVNGPCTCPPAPIPITESLLKYLMYFFTIEWTLRVICFTSDPSDHDTTTSSNSSSSTYSYHFRQWYDYLTSAPMVLDFLAIFPYYLESTDIHTLVSLRLLRLFRIFSLLRLGQYNSMMITLTNVMSKSMEYLKLLILILSFGGALFGSIVYWMERGKWKYHEPSESYQFVRLGVDGVTEEISPFRSIPIAMWWFIVTATTVGYGDCYPTSTGGQWCAGAAMLVGILVIAFPVSIFSELWSEEVKMRMMNHDDGDDDDLLTVHHDNGDSSQQNMEMEATGTTSHDQVVMDKEDVQTIAKCIRDIQENERKLHSILVKYNLESVYSKEQLP